MDGSNGWFVTLDSSPYSLKHEASKTWRNEFLQWNFIFEFEDFSTVKPSFR